MENGPGEQTPILTMVKWSTMQRFVSANNPKGPPGQQSNTRAAMAMLQTSRIQRRVVILLF